MTYLLDTNGDPVMPDRPYLVRSTTHGSGGYLMFGRDVIRNNQSLPASPGVGIYRLELGRALGEKVNE